MSKRRYEALIRLGIHYHDQWKDARRHAYEAQNEGNDFAASRHAEEMTSYGTKLQALGDVADEVFGCRYEVFMECVHDRKVKQ